MKELNPENLSRAWDAIHQNAGAAIGWIEGARKSSPRLNSEADNLVLNLRQARNQAKHLSAVSKSPSTVGFFGLSQAGKSYLISALAAGQNGQLETLASNRRLDFIEHVNPPGGGKEATGLVTRFSRRAQPFSEAFPFELKLFSEIDLVKVLTNSFFNDFNFQKISFEFKPEAARQLLDQLGKRKRQARTVAVSEDDMVSLQGYLEDRYEAYARPLKRDFLPGAISLAPWLSTEDRAQLFAFLWAGIPELTHVFLTLARTLSDLGNPEKVYAPLEALLRADDSSDELSKADSIMNVNMLGRLAAEDAPLEVQTVANGELGPLKRLTPARLAALTTELVFPLAEAPRQPLFEEVDLLDFPGYRGRKKLDSLDALSKSNDPDGSLVAELVLRGKVAYLFERYTDSQEMNLLVVCTASDKQSDVDDVGPVLEQWIQRTQGAIAEQRGKRPPGLLWAITRCDLKIDAALKHSEGTLRQYWSDMINLTMLERFGKSKTGWMTNWAPPGQLFNNTFLVRKPGMPVAFLDTKNGQELDISTEYQEQLALMKKTFAEDASVMRHVNNPDQAWQAMLLLDDGGISRISDYLKVVGGRLFKLERLAEQMAHALDDLLDNRLAPWFYEGGSAEQKVKEVLAKRVFEDLSRKRGVLGELEVVLQLPDGVMQDLYLRQDMVAEMQDEEANQEESGGGFFDFGEDSFALDIATVDVADASREVRGSDSRFAQVILSQWKEHLRGIPADDRLLGNLGLTGQKASVEALCHELITAAARLDLEGKLAAVLSRTEQVGTHREKLMNRQVLAARLVLADFITWLGYINDPLENRPNNPDTGNKPLFNPSPLIASRELPNVGEKPVAHTAIYMSDWLHGLSTLIQRNAGCAAGQEITPEQNAELGEIINNLTAVRAPNQ